MRAPGKFVLGMEGLRRRPGNFLKLGGLVALLSGHMA